MLFAVAVYSGFFLDTDQVGVVEATSILDATAQVRLWVESQVKEAGPDYTLQDVKLVPTGPDLHELVFTIRDTEGVVGEDSALIRPVQSPLMFLAEDWNLVFS